MVNLLNVSNVLYVDTVKQRKHNNAANYHQSQNGLRKIENLSKNFVSGEEETVNNFMKYIKAIDFIQWIWKNTFNTEKSKAQIRRDLEQGSVKLNDRKIKMNDVFEFED